MGKVIPLEVSTLSEQLLADRTRDEYRRDTVYFATWYAMTYHKKMNYPVSIEVVCEYVSQHGLTGLPDEIEKKLIELGIKKDGLPIWRHTTIQRRLASLAAIHNDQQVASPVASPVVKQLMRRLRRHEVSTRPKQQKAAITKPVLNQMLESCGADRLIDIRDRALLLVGFASGGRRRSEIVNMKMSDLSPCDDGYLINIPISKTDQDAVGHQVPLLGEAATALVVWLDKSGIAEGLLFRGITNSDQLLEHLSGKGVERIIKKRARLAGIDPTTLSAHSLRSGFITECSNKGISMGDVMSLTLHRTEYMLLHYYRSESLLENPAGKIL